MSVSDISFSSHIKEAMQGILRVRFKSRAAASPTRSPEEHSGEVPLFFEFLRDSQGVEP